jgi:hypothetical protein
MTANTDIVNVALRALGGTRITSLTDGSNNANAANDVYEIVRDQVLRSHPWNFATMRTQLAELGSTPAFGYDHQYALPSDWIRTISVHDNDAGLGGIDYKEETYSGQRVILANSDAVYLRYVGRVTDPNLYPPDFLVALAVEIAMRLAPAIPNSVSAKEDLEREVKGILQGAKSVDAMNQAPERRPPGSWVQSRWGWSSNRWPR